MSARPRLAAAATLRELEVLDDQEVRARLARGELHRSTPVDWDVVDGLRARIHRTKPKAAKP